MYKRQVWDNVRNGLGRRITTWPRPAYLGGLAFGLVFEAVLLVALLLISAAWLAGGTYNPFIYYRF